MKKFRIGSSSGSSASQTAAETTKRDIITIVIMWPKSGAFCDLERAEFLVGILKWRLEFLASLRYDFGCRS